MPRQSRRRGASSADTPLAIWGRRAVVAAVGVGLLVFALVGGEYDVQDLLERTERRVALDVELEELRAVRDSLRVQLDLLANDPATLERVAREEFGMVRGDKELLYRFAEPDEPDTGAGSEARGEPADAARTPTPGGQLDRDP